MKILCTPMTVRKSRRSQEIGSGFLVARIKAGEDQEDAWKRVAQHIEDKMPLCSPNKGFVLNIKDDDWHALQFEKNENDIIKRLPVFSGGFYGVGGQK